MIEWKEEPVFRDDKAMKYLEIKENHSGIINNVKMLQKTLAKILLSPFALLYGIGVSLRDFFYRKGLLKGFRFNVPVVSVGNLSVGGAGKTPHIEYLIRLLDDYINVATLSRGYKRKSEGYIEVKTSHNAEVVGDEPLQFKRKNPNTIVTVSESRAFGIPEIMRFHPDTHVILLDDAFQHRSVEPGLNILLTEYNKPFTRDQLLPVGRLREWRSAYQRADIIIVSKCPPQMSLEERDEWLKELKPYPNQKVFFSYYDYGHPYYIFNPQQRIRLEEDMDVLLISAIANTEYLIEYLEEEVDLIKNLDYEDHHYFTKFDIGRLKTFYENMPSKKTAILTTEKDAMRLELHKEFLVENKMPIFALPVEVKFHFQEDEKFNSEVREFLLNFRE